MRRALRLAQRGRGKVSPNPMVGAVVVRGDCIVGEAAHLKVGGPHAEVHALRRAGDEAQGPISMSRWSLAPSTAALRPAPKLCFALALKNSIVRWKIPMSA